MILDNVDTKEAEPAVTGILPSLSAGRVLVTSRIRDWPPTSADSTRNARARRGSRFLLERTATDRTLRMTTRASSPAGRHSDGLPLALEQAAAYIARHQMSFSDYLEDWEKERETVLGWYDARSCNIPARSP